MSRDHETPATSKSMPIVSVVIPVFNAIATLDRCVESVLSQTHRNLQCILVDDGSSDGSSIACDKWASLDERVTVLHQDNAGVSSARNAGMEASNGEFLQFADSDDFLDPDMTETLLHRATETNADVVICGYRVLLDNGDLIRARSIDIIQQVLYKDDFLQHLDRIFLSVLLNASWNKLYRRSHLLRSALAFDTSRDLGEDLLFNIGALRDARVVSILSNCLYNYIQGPFGKQLSQRHRSDRYQIQVDMLAELLSLLGEDAAYAPQSFNIRKASARNLIRGTMRDLAEHATLQTRPIYRSTLDTIRVDPLLNLLRDPNAGVGLPDRIVLFALDHRLYTVILVGLGCGSRLMRRAKAAWLRIRKRRNCDRISESTQWRFHWRIE